MDWDVACTHELKHFKSYILALRNHTGFTIENQLFDLRQLLCRDPAARRRVIQFDVLRATSHVRQVLLAFAVGLCNAIAMLFSHVRRRVRQIHICHARYALKTVFSAARKTYPCPCGVAGADFQT